MTGSGSSALLALGRVGKTLRGKWRLDRLIGHGGTGAVYEATHRNGFRAAIKVLHQSKRDESTSQRRFLREARLTNRLHHPNALQFYDDDQDDDGTPYLVMELLVGETCEARLRARRVLPPLEALRIGEAVLSVLVAAHRQGVLHRDIKPGNVFLQRGGGIKLLDFGLARAPRPSRAVSEPSLSGTQLTTVMVGTPAYMAPEQLRGELDAVDERTDLWAVGAMLFAMLTGAWDQTLDPSRLVNGARQLSPLGQLLPSAPASLRELVDRALQPASADRWPDARTMRTALRQAHRDVKAMATTVAVAEQAVVAPAPRSPTPWRWVGWAAALALGALGVGMAVALSSHDVALLVPSGQVTLVLQASPPEAELYLDGQRLPSNPYHGTLPRDGQQHELRAQAVGYGPKARTLAARNDVEIDLHLEPLERKEAPRR